MTRYLEFQNITYDTGEGDKITFFNLPHNMKFDSDDIFHMAELQFGAEYEGCLTINNIKEDALDAFDKYLSNHIDALEKLS